MLKHESFVCPQCSAVVDFTHDLDKVCRGCYKKRYGAFIEGAENMWKWACHYDDVIKERPKCLICETNPHVCNMEICTLCSMGVRDRFKNEKHYWPIKNPCICCNNNMSLKEYDLCRYCDYCDKLSRKKQGLESRKAGEGIYYCSWY